MRGFWKTLGTLFKKYFISGLLVLIPIVGTIWILKIIIVYADGVFTGLLPYKIRPEAWLGRDIPGIGLFITIALVLFVGVFTRHYVGKAMLRFGDDLIEKIPLGRGIYNSIKQFMHAFIPSEGGRHYKKIVAVEYPRKGCYMIGFVLGPVLSKIQENTEDHMISVFLPTTPNPTSGFMISVSEKDTIALQITVEQAFKYIISGTVEQTIKTKQVEYEPQNN